MIPRRSCRLASDSTIPILQEKRSVAQNVSEKTATRRRKRIKIEIEEEAQNQKDIAGISKAIENISKFKYNANEEPIASNLKRKIKIETPQQQPHPSLQQQEPVARIWETHIEHITRMRAARNAPVDKMGCEALGKLGKTDKGFRFHVLVALLLSSQTKDEIVAAAVERLSALGLTPQSIITMTDDALAKVIKPVGFYSRKAVYLKKTSAILIDQYDGDIPDSIEGLCSLPGIGPKMAYLIMSNGWKKTVGIGVDIHVHRISNRLKWINTANKTPEHSRIELENLLDEKFWTEINLLLVGFGQTICNARKPLCHDCTLQTICPSSLVKKRLIKL